MSPPPAAPLQDAIALHRRGDLDGAIARYDAILRADPRNAEALHHLAMARCQRGQFAEGIAAARAALALTPDNAATHDLLGMALARTGNAREAVASFDRAIAQRPDFAQAHGNRAGALADLGARDEALNAYERALALDPSSVGDWINQGALQFELGLHDRAIASFDRALALQPDIPDVHINRGLAHLARERAAAALQDFDRALALDPKPAAAWRHRGLALSQLDRFADAIESCDRALARDAGDRMSQFIRGLALFNLGRDAEALASLDRVIAARPNDARARSERAAVLNALDRVDDAFAELTTALSLDPKNPFVAGVAGDVSLLRGRWSQGWPLYERRFEIDPAGTLGVGAAGSDPRGPRLPFDLAQAPRWTGEPPDGRPLVLVTEQGLGDAIEFARFATGLASRGHRVLVLTAPILAPLVATVAGVERVLTSPDQLDGLAPFRWSPFLSLPALIGLTPETIPAQVPYIAVEPARVTSWRERIGPNGFKIGISWQGNPNFRFDRGRSIALAQFAPLAAIPGVRLISLQKQPGAEQIASVPFRARIETPADSADRSAGALLDLAAMMQAVDLVVTSDSMPAHLAGALGRPVSVALRRRMLDWRWLPAFGERSPWYPTMRLYRQPAEGDWAPVFARIAADVSAAVAAAEATRVSGS